MMVTKDGLRPDPEKVRAVQEMAKPRTATQVCQFLGLTSYYRRFIKDYASIANPLYRLVTSQTSITLDDEARIAFNKLKEKLIGEAIIVIFNPDLPIFIHCDGSKLGLGCILSHSDKSNEKVVGYFSRSLNKAEKNYSASEIEMLAVIFSIKKCRHYLYQRKFTVVVDHHSLCGLIGRDVNGRLLRWQLYLQEYEFVIKYKKGSQHCNADCLSRRPLPETIPETADTDHDNTLSLLTDAERLSTAQTNDEFCKTINRKIEINKIQNFKGFYVKDNVLFKMRQTDFGRRDVPVLPEKWIRDVLEELHDGPFSCHRGIASTLYNLNKRFFVRNAESKVRTHIKSCDECQKQKAANRSPDEFLQSLPTSTEPWHTICIDFAGPLVATERGNKHIIVIIDVASRYIETAATQSQSADETADVLLRNIIFRHGAPKVLISDQGRNFLSQTVRLLLRRLGP